MVNVTHILPHLKKKSSCSNIAFLTQGQTGLCDSGPGNPWLANMAFMQHHHRWRCLSTRNRISSCPLRRVRTPSPPREGTPSTQPVPFTKPRTSFLSQAHGLLLTPCSLPRKPFPVASAKPNPTRSSGSKSCEHHKATSEHLFGNDSVFMSEGFVSPLNSLEGPLDQDRH